MKVVHLCNFDRPEAGAFIPMVRSVLLTAVERGHTAEAALLEESRGSPWIEDLAGAGIRVSFAPALGKAGLARWLRQTYLVDSEPTVLHSHFTKFDVPAALASLGRSDTAVFWHIHSTLMNDIRARLRNMAKFGTLGRTVDGILCPAENIAADVERRLGPRGRVHFLPSAIDVDSYPLLGEEARLEARDELELGHDALAPLHFGWHWYLKGGDIFLDTVAELRRRGISGMEALERGGAEHAQKEIEAAGLEDIVRVVPPVKDIRTLFAAADVLVSSSRSEGMAYSVLESLCCGTPVIATQIPGHTFIGRDVSACRISSRSPAALAQNVQELLARDEATAAAEAAQAREWIRAHLGLDVIAERLVRNYEAALRGEDPQAWSYDGGDEAAGNEDAWQDRLARTPRIIHLAAYDSPQTGSFIPMLTAILERAEGVGWDAEVIFSQGGGRRWDWLGEFERAGIPVRFAPAGSRIEVGQWLKGVVGETAQPTILHTHFTEFDLPAIFAARGRAATPVYWHAHSALGNRVSNVVRNSVKFGAGGRLVDRILCPSYDQVAALERRMAPAGRVEFFPNAIDVGRFPLTEATAKRVSRERLGIDSDAVVLLSFAWDWEMKGGDRFAAALARLRRRLPERNVTGVVITAAPQAESARADLGLGDALHIVAPGDGVAWLFTAADIFVAASRAEGGTPFAVLEALATGLPVVASDLPGHSFICAEVDGCRIVPGEPQALVEGIASVVESGTAPEFAVAARASIERRFSIDDWCNRLIGEYRNSLATIRL